MKVKIIKRTISKEEKELNNFINHLDLYQHIQNETKDREDIKKYNEFYENFKKEHCHSCSSQTCEARLVDLELCPFYQDEIPIIKRKETIFDEEYFDALVRKIKNET